MDGFTDFAMNLLNHEGGGSLFPPLMSSSFEQRYLSTNLFSSSSSSNVEMTQFGNSGCGALSLPLMMRRDPATAFSYFDREEISDISLVPEASHKRFRPSSISPADSFRSLEAAILRNQFLSNPPKFSSVPLNSPPPPPVNRHSPAPKDVLARERRKLLSDRLRCLQKLMPWDKKMDTATMLEEAYRYIKFLQAQVSVLQSMPCQSSFITPLQMKAVNNVGGGSGSGNGGFGGLERLNRQQLLQVLVNSPVAQTVLYSTETCVYSREQLILMKNQFVLQQMMMASSSSSGT